ncbi:porin family protein [Terriglobus albidus]|uniref:porin family protein n=1 Tax=Terriglobus albidus TaxID=1592106 RepID=UPI0021E02A1F|nr:porin family protein [Terriglobus albidus]
MYVRTKLAVAVLAAISILSISSPHSNAQAIPAGYKRGGDIDAFFTYGRARTDFGSAQNNLYTLGGDYMFRYFGMFQPGINVRYIHSTGAVVDEPFFGGGIDLRFRQFWRLRPYGVADMGIGSVKEKSPGIDDSGVSYILGGGIDVPIVSRFAARAEFNSQHILISGGKGPDLTFTPYSLNVGVVYHIR